MSSVRPLRPTDLAALAAFVGRAGRNEALTWERLRPSRGTPGLLLRSLEQSLPLPFHRHMWIRAHGPLITGLVSASRQRPTTWEIDWLLTTTGDAEGGALALLDGVARAAGRAGAVNVLLRLATNAALLPLAHRAGYMTYAVERVLTLAGPPRRSDDLPPTVSLRPRERADDLGLFQLYNRAVPGTVRMHEAGAFAEWRAVEETRDLGTRAADLIAERDGQIIGRVRTGQTDDGPRLALQVDGAVEREVVNGLLGWALRDLGSAAPILALAPGYAVGVTEALAEVGFERVDEHALLSKRLTRTVRLPRTAAVAVRPAIPV